MLAIKFMAACSILWTSLLLMITPQRFILVAQYSLSVPSNLMGRPTEGRDYFHVIVWYPGCVTHQLLNPVVSQCLGLKDPVAGQIGFFLFFFLTV